MMSCDNSEKFVYASHDLRDINGLLMLDTNYRL